MKRVIGIAPFASWAVVTLALTACLVACSDDKNKPGGYPADPMAEINQPEEPRQVRPPPAKSGLGSNPSDPNGLPGPASGLGTSSNRY